MQRGLVYVTVALPYPGRGLLDQLGQDSRGRAVRESLRQLMGHQPCAGRGRGSGLCCYLAPGL